MTTLNKIKYFDIFNHPSNYLYRIVVNDSSLTILKCQGEYF